MLYALALLQWLWFRNMFLYQRVDKITIDTTNVFPNLDQEFNTLLWLKQFFSTGLSLRISNHAPLPCQSMVCGIMDIVEEFLEVTKTVAWLC